ncbi:SH3 domain-containing C40 family peptidase [Paenibacillus sp. B01]|uniref:C40 family peptidase n=1 Tax=Paenibacillus sp. B01 TaxID=2660554 RepID=UPI001891A396|nr:SH3 domain-containing C40 family peptidase [Paenibacillus sp. B01]
MRKPVAAVLAASLLLAGMPPTGAEAAPSAAAQLAVTQSTVNLREEPSTKGKVLRLLAKGEPLTVLERVDGSWYKVKERAGKIGFVSSSSAYISLIEEPAASAKPSLAANAEIAATVTLRKSASASSDRIRYLNKGEQVQIVAVPTAYWYLILDEQGNSGYISSDKKYVTVTGVLPGASTPAPSATPTATPTPTPSKTPAASATPAASKTPAASATPTPSKTPAATATPTPSKTPAATATPTPSKTPAASATPTPSKTPAATATPTPSKTPAASATPTPSKTPAASATPTPEGGTEAFSPNAKAVSAVAFRIGPSTSQDRIRYLKTGEAVQIVSTSNRSWYQIVDASGQSGYVSSDAKYIALTGTLPSAPTATPAPSASPTPSAAPASPTPAPSGDGEGLASPELEAVIAAGLKYLGTPYEFGSSRNDTTTFDCSDFVRQAFLDALGIKLAADSRGQGQQVKNKGAYTQDWNELKRGDLMFFTTTAIGKDMTAEESLDASLISHVGIYLGDNKILQTYSKESGGVQVTDIPQNSTWKTRFMFGGSAL